MQLVDFQTFEERIAAGWRPKMNTTIYESLPFDCACGEAHIFGHATVLKELPGMRLVLSCPSLKAATCIKIKGFIRLRIQSEFGAGL